VAALSTLKTTPERIRLWGIRSGISILDQGLTSGAGFLLNLFLARWLPADAYGAFAVTFATVLFLAGFHNVLLLEPMCVFGPSNYVDRTPAYFVGQIKVHAVLVGILSILLLLTAAAMAGIKVSQQLVSATAGSAVALPFLLLLWLVRRMCYVVHRPSAAVWGSAGYLFFMLVGLFTLRTEGWLNPVSAFLLMATASIPAALVLLWQLGVMRETSFDACPWRHVLRENWNYGRWLVGSTILNSAASQTQTYLTAVFVGLGAAGILRAMQIPSLIMTQIIIAVGLLVLPTMSSDFGRGRIPQLRRKAVLCTIFLTALALAFAFVLGLFARPIESLLYGGRFSTSAWLIPILALVPVCTGFTTGFSIAVRAYQRPRLDLLTNAIAAPVGLVTAVVLIKVWGLAGAGLSLVAGSAAYGIAFLWMFLRMGSKDSGVGDVLARVESPV
jgi:O-antigen/teichoic acid export membrane protein